MKSLTSSIKCLFCFLVISTLMSYHLYAQTQLWSMTNTGGANNEGAIISFNPANGDELVQHSFSNSGDGYYPFGSLVAVNSLLYGMTSSSDGANGALFSFNPATGKDSILHNFGGIGDGIYPTGSMVLYNNLLYGMTSGGGANNAGVLFSYSPSAGTYTKLYDFDPNLAGSPQGSLIVYNSQLWGLALSSYVSSGHNGCIFSFDPSTNSFSDHYNFPGPYPYALGENPYGDLTVLNSKLYGTTSYGCAYGYGGFFSYTPSTNSYSLLYSFNKNPFSTFYNSQGPTGNVIVYNGKLYGMSLIGGSHVDSLNSASGGYGYIYSYDPNTSTFTDIYDFDGVNGRNPKGSLYLYSGKLYGMTTASGTNTFYDGPGVIFSFNPTSNTFKNEVNFNNDNGGKPAYSSFISFTTSLSQTISTGSVTGTYCSGASVSVSYTANGTFTSGNVFYAQLSDSSGHFSNAVNIGSTTSISSGSISATIPSGTLTSSHYLIRVISTMPAIAGLNNGTNIAINQTPNPVINPSGSVTICSGSSITLQASSGSGYSYQWKIGGTVINGATASSYNTSGSGSYSVTETFATCSATSATPAVITVDSYNPTISPSGSVNICNSSSLLLQTTKITGDTYQWKKNGVDISAATSFKYTATAAGSYTVRVSDGICSFTSVATSVTMSAPPAATISPSGGVTTCTGTPVSLQANTGNGLSYQWKKNGSNINGATSSSYSASTAASYTVVVSLGQCSATSSATTVAVDAGPTATVSPSGTVTICPGVSQTLTANTGGGLNYQWLKSGVSISGATTHTYSTSSTGGYSVIETDANGCSKTSAKTTIKNYTVTVKITNSGSLNICNTGSVTLNAQVLSGYTYQWYDNDAPIPGATATSYIATAAGIYKYLATTPNGCTKFSSTKTVSGCKTAETDYASDEAMVLFPNPAHDEVTVDLSGDEGDYEIEIMNMQGQILLTSQSSVESGNNSMTIRLSSLPAGMYLVREVSATSQHVCVMSKE